jgi:hypothetical protein
MSEPERFEINDYQKTVLRTNLKVMFTEYENSVELLLTIIDSLKRENSELKKQLQPNK